MIEGMVGDGVQSDIMKMTEKEFLEEHNENTATRIFMHLKYYCGLGHELISAAGYSPLQLYLDSIGVNDSKQLKVLLLTSLYRHIRHQPIDIESQLPGLAEAAKQLYMTKKPDPLFPGESNPEIEVKT